MLQETWRACVCAIYLANERRQREKEKNPNPKIPISDTHTTAWRVYMLPKGYWLLLRQPRKADEQCREANEV